MNKHYYLAILICFLAFSSHGQAIIPFVDLSDQNRTLFGEPSNSNKSDYHNYPSSYQKTLINIDKEIKEVDQAIRETTGQSNQERLQTKKSKLLAKRELLLEEAGLLDDLNEFY